MENHDTQEIIEKAKALFAHIDGLDMVDKIEIINEIRSILHTYSPFAKEPVDCVLWLSADQVQANDYNPNAVAPPEMRLLEHSIREDGYTQPIVGFKTNSHYEVVDGFHRNRIGREIKDIQERLRGYLPLTIINPGREGRNDRIATTIRHNRARGKHQVGMLSEIIQELARRNWSDKKIAKELGMEPDEVLRLKQITGLADLFADREFSEAWEYQEEIE